MADHAAAVRSAVAHAVGDHTAAVHTEVILADHIAVVRGVDSQVAHTVVVLTEAAHTEVARMAMAVIANSELKHPDLGIHHTTYFAH